jgi:endonuclease/exonuclease/phosphatase family metal-dependent hydrolase
MARAKSGITAARIPRYVFTAAERVGAGAIVWRVELAPAGIPAQSRGLNARREFQLTHTIRPYAPLHPQSLKSMSRLRRFITPGRFSLSAVLALALFLAHTLDSFQLSSGLGRAEASEACFRQAADWADPAAASPPVAVRAGIPPLRVAVYNLHSGLGPDWRLYAPRREVEHTLSALARRIAEAAPGSDPIDAVALNEVDFGSRRSGWLDEAGFLADELQRLTGNAYAVARGETWRRDFPGLEVRFGNAALVRHPVLATESCILGKSCGGEPAPARYAAVAAGTGLGRLFNEPRGVLRVSVDFHGRPIDLLVSHLEAFLPSRREAQAAEVLERFVRPGATTVLLADTNTVPTAMTRQRPHLAADRTHDILTGGSLLDARIAAAARTGAGDLSPWATYPAEAPLWPLDGILATPDLAPLAVDVIGGRESDHRGLAARYGWATADAAAAQQRWRDILRQRQRSRLSACDLAEAGTERTR